MIGAATTLFVLLLTAEFGSETVEVKDRGSIDLASFECRDTPRSTLIQRACYDPMHARMIVKAIRRRFGAIRCRGLHQPALCKR